METLRFMEKVKDGKIIINVPENLDGKNLDITITEANEDKAQHNDELLKTIRAQEVMKYFGTANFPDIDLDKYNSYEQ